MTRQDRAGAGGDVGRPAGGGWDVRDRAGLPVPDGLVGELTVRTQDGRLVHTGWTARTRRGRLELFDRDAGLSADAVLLSDDSEGIRIHRLGAADNGVLVCLVTGSDRALTPGQEALWDTVRPAGDGSPVVVPVLQWTSPPAPTEELSPGPAARDELDAVLEEVITAVWCQVLGTEIVGAEDDFFDLGGHSLLATRIVAQISELVGARVRVTMLLEHPTVPGLSAVIRERLDQAQADRLLNAGRAGAAT